MRAELDATAEVGRSVPEAILERFALSLERGVIDERTTGLAGRRLVDLAERWRLLRGEDSLGNLAWALRAASRTAALERADETVDLVWTGPVSGRHGLLRIEQCLLDLVHGARTELLLVTFAATAVDEVRAALRAAIERGVRIRVVAEHDASKLRTGGRFILDGDLHDRVEVFAWPAEARERLGEGYGTLHAKCAIADDRELLVSSANLTGHAMAINIELGIRVRGGSAPRRVREHFDELITAGVLVPRGEG